MRIAQVCPFFLPVEGGMERHVYYISKELVKRGHKVVVFTTNVDRQGRILPKREIINGIEVRRYPVLFSIGEFAKFWPSFIVDLWKERFDIVHVHNYRHPHTILAAIVCKLKGIPCVLTTHAPFHKNVQRRLIARIFLKLYDLFAPILNKLFSQIVIVVPQEKTVLRGHLLHVPNGIPKTIIRSNPAQSTNHYVITIGRIHPTKGHDLLIRALSNTSIKIVAIGPLQDGHFLQKCNKLADKCGVNFNYLGVVNENTKFQLIDGALFLVLPSRYEPFGIVILEAFARGKPVVAFRSPGPEYLIRDGVDGFLVENGNIEELREKILLLTENKKLRESMGRNAIERAKEFTWENIVNRIEALYYSLLHKNNKDLPKEFSTRNRQR